MKSLLHFWNNLTDQQRWSLVHAFKMACAMIYAFVGILITDKFNLPAFILVGYSFVGIALAWYAKYHALIIETLGTDNPIVQAIDNSTPVQQ